MGHFLPHQNFVHDDFHCLLGKQRDGLTDIRDRDMEQFESISAELSERFSISR